MRHLNSLLCPGTWAVRWLGSKFDGQRIVIAIESARPAAHCPLCNRRSSRVHSRYLRTLVDLPWHGTQVRIEWHSRRLFCEAPNCPRKIFTERLPEVAEPHGRKTVRLATALRALALACGGEGGMHLSQRLGMPSSAATLLRIIRRQPLPTQPTPRILGVDDWSFRRGHRYGTILCDLERRCVVDLLPERSSESFQAWLTAHPGVEVISRDRGDYYIKGAAAGAPEAIQVADRWHLLANLRESLFRIADRHPGELVAAARAVIPQPSQITLPAKSRSIRGKMRLTRLEVIQAERQMRRRQRYKTIKALRRQRISLREIARQLGLSRCTVRRYANARQCPERDGRRYVRATDPFVNHLHQRWRMGCRNAAELFAELRQQGFSGSYDMVRRRVAAWRKREAFAGKSCQSLNRRRLSANQVAWLLIKPDSTLTDQDRRSIQAIETHCPTLGEASRLAKRFRTILHQQKPQSLDAWLQAALRPEVAMELRRFAKGVYADLAAVRSAFALPWSNGQTEGQVNRLKMIKRQMFGRAKFDLLRHRVLEMGA